MRNGFRLGGIELGAVVEVVGEGFLGGLVLFCPAGPHVELGLGWPPGRVDEGEDFIDPGQEGGPFEGPGRGGVGWLGWWTLWLGRRARRSQGRFGIRELSGEGVVLPGPFSDQRPQGSVGGEDAVVTVPVDAGRGEDRGQAVQELESGETEGGAARRIGPRQEIAEHVLGFVGLQEVAADHVAEDPFSHRVLQALEELMGEGGGFVEARAGFWIGRILIRVILDPMEEPIHDAQVVVVVRLPDPEDK